LPNLHELIEMNKGQKRPLIVDLNPECLAMMISIGE